MRVLIALTGAATSGKSLVSRRLSETHGFKTCRFAEPIKRMLGVGLGLTAEQLDGSEKQSPIPEFGGLTTRHLMQTLGYEWGRRMVHSDIWITAWKRDLARQGNLVVVDDLRFPNEAMAIRELGGIIWRVNRPGVPVLDHASERASREIAVDQVVQNISTINALMQAVDAQVSLVLKKGGAHELG